MRTATGRGPNIRALSAAAVGLALGALISPLAVPVITGRSPPDAVARAIEANLAGAGADPVTAFYAQRRDAALWVRAGRLQPPADELIADLKAAGADDLNPAAYAPDSLAGELADARARPTPRALARADVDLSRAFSRWIHDLRTAPPEAAFRFVDPDVRIPPADPGAILSEAAAQPNLDAALSDAQRMNPLYVSLRAALADARNAGDGHASLIALNLERARGLPPDLGGRYIRVNPAAETLTFSQAGAAPRTMPVVIGMMDDQTPDMIGLVRYALFNPYWNVPPDLVRQRLAPQVLRDGPGLIARRRFEVLADYTPGAAVLDPAAVDWRAVAAGTTTIRVRQRPGGDNMMGQVKFMLPNTLGIYLHDTPQKGLFAADVRTDSHGCVRLKDAALLGQWIFGHPVAPAPTGPPDQRADIRPPIPVYVVYLTAEPRAGGGVDYLPDIYGRDRPLMAALSARRGGVGDAG